MQEAIGVGPSWVEAPCVFVNAMRLDLPRRMRHSLPSQTAPRIKRVGSGRELLSYRLLPQLCGGVLPPGRNRLQRRRGVPFARLLLSDASSLIFYELSIWKAWSPRRPTRTERAPWESQRLFTASATTRIWETLRGRATLRSTATWLAEMKHGTGSRAHQYPPL